MYAFMWLFYGVVLQFEQFIIIKMEANIPPSESDVLCEFDNINEEQIFRVNRDIYIQSQRSLRHDPSPDPNRTIRITRRIYQNYITLIRSIKSVQCFLRNYKDTLDIQAEKQRLASSEQSRPEEQSLKRQTETEGKCLPMIISKIALLKDRQQKQAISYAMNKLKCMIIKARYKQSTSLDHLTETYLSKLKSILVYEVRYRQEKSERHKLMELQTIRNEFIMKTIETIKRKYEVIEMSKLQYYKIQPCGYFQELKKGYPEKPIFFINLYAESLLFVNENYIGGELREILYCPLVYNGSSIRISKKYQEGLLISNNQWSNYQINIEVYHLDTSLEKPIFYSRLKQIKKSTLMQQRNLPNRILQQLQRLQYLMNNIESIKRFVFSKLILNWLGFIHNNQQQTIQIMIKDKFKVLIRGCTEQNLTLYEDDDLICFRPEIIANLLLIASDPKNPFKVRKELRQGIRSQLEATIFKIVAEKVGMRASWPLESFSLGHFYYQYNSDRIVNRREVDKFFSQF